MNAFTNVLHKFAEASGQQWSLAALRLAMLVGTASQDVFMLSYFIPMRSHAQEGLSSASAKAATWP